MTDPVSKGETTLYAFVSQVARTGGLDSLDEAEQVTRVTLTVLAEALSSGQRSALTGGLPPELADALTGRTDQAKAINRHTMLDRVSAASHSHDLDRVETQVRAVLSTLTDWSPPQQIDDALAQLPPDVGDLLPTHRK